jgi:hypothetical protein
VGIYEKRRKEMAHIDEANMNGKIERHANISDIVGPGQINKLSDVMLIQALFSLIGLKDEYRKSILSDVPHLPAINGIFDEKTRLAIWSFQNASSFALLSVDGRVHPALYENRIIRPGRKMMITVLNELASWTLTVAVNSSNVINALNVIAPQLFLLPAISAA